MTGISSREGYSPRLTPSASASRLATQAPIKGSPLRQPHIPPSSQTDHELAPPNCLGFQKPRAHALGELLRRHASSRIQVPEGDDEDVAGGDTCANESGARYVVRHFELSDVQQPMNKAVFGGD